MYSLQENESTGKDRMVKEGNGDRLWEDRFAAMHVTEDHDSLHNSYRSARTDVTGISGLTMNSAFGSIPIQPGELTSEPFERPLSAPPPPGFGLGPEERTRKAQELFLPRPTHSIDDDSGTSSKNGDHRSSSFSNLAAVLGTGLAQSMEDATHERHFAELFAKPEGDLSLHRQTRHAAARLLGVSSSGEAPKLKKSASEAFVERGFPSSLSTPQKRNSSTEAELAAATREAMRGSTTPVQMFPSDRRSHPAPKNIGTNVSEPEGENSFCKDAVGVVSHRIDDPMDRKSAEMQFDVTGIHSSLSLNAREFRPTAIHSEAIMDELSNDSLDNGSELSARQAETELKPFLWDAEHNTPSRALAILHVSYLRVPDVRSACETFGVLESFRSEYSSRGIYLISYYDIRSAQYAAVELQPILQRLVIMQRSSEEVVVRYCLPLNSSSQFDDAQIVLSELSPEYNEYTLRSLLSAYGSVRSVTSQGMGAFAIEFHNIQDAKQAQLELESSQPFGPSVFVELGMRTPAVRRKGRELLTLIGRWRQALSRRPTPSRPDTNLFASNPMSSSTDPWRSNQQANASSLLASSTEVVGLGAAYGNIRGQNQHQHHQETQFVLGPDGRYTPVVVQSQMPFSSFSAMGATPIDPRQQIIQGPDGQMYLAPMPAGQSGGHAFSRQPVNLQNARFTYPGAPIISNPTLTEMPRRAPPPTARTPYYTHVVSDAGSLSGRSHRSAYSTGTTEAEKDTRHLVLDLDLVEHGQDSRTSLMVRNIPNKYTQQMLLSEFEENGHGPGVIDFFYLPIDFKNRCNRGYAFINFVDYRDILAFHKQYYGKHWRTFNSDKICDITYARIQGKAAMLKRFENSALMEKDDEYKPLVFVSNGPDKGKRLPFPDPNTKPVMG